MCESPREVDDVNNLDYHYTRQKIDAMKARRRFDAENAKANNRRPSDPAVPSASRSASMRNELLHSIRNNSKLQKLQQQQQQQQQQVSTESTPTSPSYHAQTTTDEVTPIQQQQQLQPNNTTLLYPPPSRPPSPGLLRHSTSNESNRSLNHAHQQQQHSSSHNPHHSPPRQHFALSKLPTPRLALLTGSRKLISRLGQMPTLDHPDSTDMETSPVCYLLDKPATLRELTLESTEHMSGHILVCMHHKVSNIFKFIYNLR